MPVQARHDESRLAGFHTKNIPTLSAQVAQSQASHPAPQTPAGPPGVYRG